MRKSEQVHQEKKNDPDNTNSYNTKKTDLWETAMHTPGKIPRGCVTHRKWKTRRCKKSSGSSSVSYIKTPTEYWTTISVPLPFPATSATTREREDCPRKIKHSLHRDNRNTSGTSSQQDAIHPIPSRRHHRHTHVHPPTHLRKRCMVCRISRLSGEQWRDSGRLRGRHHWAPMPQIQMLLWRSRQHMCGWSTLPQWSKGAVRSSVVNHTTTTNDHTNRPSYHNQQHNNILHLMESNYECNDTTLLHS